MLDSPVSRTIAAILVVAVPIAAVITRFVVGRDNSFGGPETVAWSPLFNAQLLIAALFLTFGPQSLLRRTFIFVLCGMLFTVQQLFAFDQVAVSHQGFLQRWINEAQGSVKYILLPPLVFCLALSPTRRLIGEMRFGSAPVSRIRFSIHDMLVVTTLVATLLAWCKFRHLSLEVIGVILTLFAMEILAAVCLAHSVLARHGRVCSFVLFVAFAVIRATIHSSWGMPWTIIFPTLQWFIMFALLYGLRCSGLCLLGWQAPNNNAVQRSPA